MTQQHIEEFLKYASPRLDYIGHCMEKQALMRIVRAAKKMPKLDRKNVDRAIDIGDQLSQEMYGVADITKHMNVPRINREAAIDVMSDLIPNYSEAFNSIKKRYPQFSDKQIERFIRNGRLASMKAGKNPVYMYPSMASTSYTYAHFWRPEAIKKLFDFSPQPPPVAKSYPIAIRSTNAVEGSKATKGNSTVGNRIAAGLDESDVEIYPPNSPEAKAWRNKYKKQAPVTEAEVVDAAPVNANTAKVTREISNGLASRDNTAIVPVKDSVKQPKGQKTPSTDTEDTANWFKMHPYLTAAGTTAGGSALGTGLGYALGHSSGSEEATKKLHTYYAINEALRRNALRRANSDILARLANIFGAGELNDLIVG